MNLFCGVFLKVGVKDQKLWNKKGGHEPFSWNIFEDCGKRPKVVE